MLASILDASKDGSRQLGNVTPYRLARRLAELGVAILRAWLQPAGVNSDHYESSWNRSCVRCNKGLPPRTTDSMKDVASSQADFEAASVDGAAATAQDKRYLEAAALYGPALERMARGYESDPSRRQDLLQDVHVALWRSLAIFDNRCSLRTWVYRVAHHTATKHMVANRRVRLHEMHTLDDVPHIEDDERGMAVTDQADSLRRLLKLIEQLKPLDRQVILLYLEDISADAIGEVVGLSPANIATKICRIKKVLASMFQGRGAL